MRYSSVVLLLAAFFIPVADGASALAQTSQRRPCDSLLSRDQPGAAAATYFPANIFPEWYAKYFPKMKESPLHPLINCQVESYRFLWLRSFHAPITVRLWRSDGKEFLTVKKLRFRENYEPGKLVVNKMRSLSADEWKEFKRLLDNISYWGLPTKEEAPLPVIDAEGRESITIRSDGAQWIIEGMRDGRYHVVDRRSAKGEYRAAGLYLLKLSGLKIEEDEIY